MHIFAAFCVFISYLIINKLMLDIKDKTLNKTNFKNYPYSQIYFSEKLDNCTIITSIFSHLDKKCGEKSLRILPECGKIRTRITRNIDTFHAEIKMIIISKNYEDLSNAICAIPFYFDSHHIVSIHSFQLKTDFNFVIQYAFH